MTSVSPTDLLVRRAAERIVAATLRVPTLAGWEAARALGEVADEAGRTDLVCDWDSPETVATIGAVTALVGELRAYCEHGPVPTPEAYEAACKALEKHRQRADAAEAELKRRLCTLHALAHRDGDVQPAEIRAALSGDTNPNND